MTEDETLLDIIIARLKAFMEQQHQMMRKVAVNAY